MSPKEDVNELAFDVLQRATGQKPKEGPTEPDPDEAARKNAAALLGRLGGKKGGPARAAKLSAKRRREIAQKAAKTRWRK